MAHGSINLEKYLHKCYVLKCNILIIIINRIIKQLYDFSHEFYEDITY